MAGPVLLRKLGRVNAGHASSKRALQQAGAVQR